MPLVVADRVKETTSTAGTGTITLAGAATGFQSFSVIGNANQTYYTIAGQGTSEWEVGIGTYTASGTTLSRDSVLSSSASGAKVSFSAGTKDVFVVYPSGRAVYGDTVGNVTITTNFQAARLTAADSTANATLLYGDAYSVSGSAAIPMVDMSGIWNTTGEPTLVKYNVTNTASGTNSLLLDLQVGGSSRFRVDKDGDVFAASSIFGAAVSVSSALIGTTGTLTNLTATNETVTSLTATNETVTSLTVTNETVSTIIGAASSYCDMDTIQGDILIASATPNNLPVFYSDSASISGSNASALFDVSATWNTTGSPTGFKLNVADSASDTLSSFIDLQRNSVSQFKIDKYGAATATGLVVSANTTSNAVRITQTGTGNAFVIEDSANPDSTPIVVDKDGFALFNIPTAITGAQVQWRAYMDGFNFSNDAVGPAYRLFKGRGTSDNFNTPVQVNDVMGYIDFFGSDGTYPLIGVRVQSVVYNTPGSLDMPGQFEIHTSPDGGYTPAIRVAVNASGLLASGVRVVNTLNSGNIPSTEDAVVLAGRAGGSSSYAVTLTPTTLTGNRTLTLPDPGSNETLGYLNVPQNEQTGSYTLVLSDAGKHIYRASGTAATWTIPAASSVSYPIGTVLTFINLSATSVSIAITTDTMYLSSAGTTGTRTLAQYGYATAIKVSGVSSSGVWVISGSGLT